MPNRSNFIYLGRLFSLHPVFCLADAAKESSSHHPLPVLSAYFLCPRSRERYHELNICIIAPQLQLNGLISRMNIPTAHPAQPIHRFILIRLATNNPCTRAVIPVVALSARNPITGWWFHLVFVLRFCALYTRYSAFRAHS